MPRIFKCSFCGHDITPGTGMIYVKNDGTIYRFCSRKCMVSLLKFRRNPKKLKWTKKYKSNMLTKRI